MSSKKAEGKKKAEPKEPTGEPKLAKKASKPKKKAKKKVAEKKASAKTEAAPAPTPIAPAPAPAISSSSASSSGSNVRKIWVNYNDMYMKVEFDTSKVQDIDDLRQHLISQLKISALSGQIRLENKDGTQYTEEDASIPEGFSSKADSLRVVLLSEKEMKKGKPKENDKAAKEKGKQKGKGEKETIDEEFPTLAEAAKVPMGKEKKEEKKEKKSIEFDEEKYSALSSESKAQIEHLLQILQDLNGALDAKRSERKPIRQSKSESLAAIRQVIGKIKEERKSLPGRAIAPLPALRENDEKAFAVRDEKKDEKKEEKENDKQEVLDEKTLTERRQKLDDLKKAVSLVSANVSLVCTTQEKVDKEKDQGKKKTLTTKWDGEKKKRDESIKALEKFYTTFPKETETGALVSKFLDKAKQTETKKGLGDFNALGSSTTQTIFAQMKNLLAQIKEAKGTAPPKKSQPKKESKEKKENEKEKPAKEEKKKPVETKETKETRKRISDLVKERQTLHETYEKWKTSDAKFSKEVEEIATKIASTKAEIFKIVPAKVKPKREGGGRGGRGGRGRGGGGRGGRGGRRGGRGRGAARGRGRGRGAPRGGRGRGRGRGRA